MTKVALFHTTKTTLALMTQLTEKLLPNTEVLHLVEESMIKDIMKNNGSTPAINARIAGYIQMAEKAQCDIFMTACSSIGGIVEQCQFLTEMPLMRIDSAMVEEAINIGGRIAVLATVETTLKPTLEFMQRQAEQKGVKLNMTPMLMADAYLALLAGDDDKHDQIVAQGLQKAIQQSDVIVLAQASMARVLQHFSELTMPVLTSPESGIVDLAKRVESIIEMK